MTNPSTSRTATVLAVVLCAAGGLCLVPPASHAATALDLSAYHVLPGGSQLLSFDTTVRLRGGVTARPGDVVRVDGLTYSVEFDAAANGLPAAVKTDALSRVGGDLLLSFDTTVSLGSFTVGDEDLVRFNGGSFALFFDGSAEGVPTALDLDAAHYAESNERLLLSFDGSGEVGGVAFDDEDVLEFDPVGSTWALASDGSADNLPAAVDLNAYHQAADGSEKLSFDTTAGLPGSVTVAPGHVAGFDGSTYALGLALTPAAGCRRPVAFGKSLLTVKDQASDTKDRLLWKWVKGSETNAEDFGDPLTTTDYTLRLYDAFAGTSTLTWTATVTAGGLCGGRPCWKATAAGFKYKESESASEGVRTIVLKAGADGKAKVLVKEQGPNLALPSLPLSQESATTVQLVSSDGACWGATYAAPARRNRSDQFKDKGG